MCRSIKQLRQSEQAATSAEIEAAALQFVRKVSGYRKPSKANEAVFEQAVAEIALATQQLLDNLISRPRQTSSAPKSQSEYPNTLL